MNLYLITQSVNTGYDTYDSAIVVARNETDAAFIHPDTDIVWKDGCWCLVNGYMDWTYGDWVNPDQVSVQLIGKATPQIVRSNRRVILASFNAG